MMKLHLAVVTLVVGGFCIFYLFYNSAEKDHGTPQKLSPYIRLDGSLEETAYRHTSYKDPGAEVMQVVNGELRCSGTFLRGKGNLDTRVTGTYLLHYDTTDHEGHDLPAVTRTVHVVENAAAFLNGVYNVTCSYTSTIGYSAPTFSINSYIATVSPGSKNYSFELNRLKIGPTDVIPVTQLEDQGMSVFFASPDFDLTQSFCTGTLSPSKTSFTIESTVVKSFPFEKHTSKNVFTKSKHLPL